MEAVLRSCKDLSAFLLRLKIRDIFFEKQCCAVAWTKGIHPASEKISKKQCCAVAPTYSAFLLRLKIGHIFFLSIVALLRGDWDSDCFRKSLWKAVLRSCKDLSAFRLRLKIGDIFFEKQCCAVAWTKGIHTASEKISKKQCCAVASTYSAFLLGLNFANIFF